MHNIAYLTFGLGALDIDIGVGMLHGSAVLALGWLERRVWALNTRRADWLASSELQRPSNQLDMSRVGFILKSRSIDLDNAFQDTKLSFHSTANTASEFEVKVLRHLCLHPREILI